MKKTRLMQGVMQGAAALIFGLAVSMSVEANLIGNVVETGGDNEATDTIPAKWTGQTFPVSVANEPVPGLVIGDSYTVGYFGNLAPSFVDRSHRYWDDTVSSPNLMIPAYLVGGEYIMTGNDNRDNNAAPTLYSLDVTLNQAAIVYMLIDNRLSDGDNLTPPTFGPTSMQWILDQGWAATANGLNRLSDPSRPDELAFDEGADSDTDQWYSIYKKAFGPGTLTLGQPDNAGRNMYGVVVTAIPEPSALTLLALGGLGVAAALRRRCR